MKTKRFLALLLMLSMLIGMMPTAVFAYHEESFFDGDSVDVRTEGKTYSLFTEDNLEGQDGTTFLYVVKSGDRYYTLGNPRYTTFKEVDSVYAVDITEYYDAQNNTFSGIPDSANVGAMQYQMNSGSYMYVDGDMLFALSVPFESEGNEWFDGGIRYYSPDETYSYSRPIWHSNGDGTGYFYDSYVDWFSSPRVWTYGVLDLKYTGTSYVFALRDKSTEYTEAKNAEPDNYNISVGSYAYLYAAPCGHEQNVHGDAYTPTCMEKGCHEYWYCHLCGTYFSDKNMTVAFDDFPEIDALGHDFDSEKCKNCNRPVPVYSKVTNKTDFFALADDTMYVLVAEYEGKYYTPDSSVLYSYVFDLDGDGYADIYNVDENDNGTPDVAEIDWDENGVFDLWDYPTEEERREYFDSICRGYLTDMLYGQTVGIPVKEITINPDGTISHDAVKDALEFEMIKLHSQEEINDSEEVFRYTYECVMQFVIPNTFINSPAFIPEDRPLGKEYPDEGDTYYWAVLFYNDRDSYYTYDWENDTYVGGLPFLDVCKDGSIALSKSWNTFSPEWGSQLECLRLRDYDGKLSFVVGSNYDLEGSEWVDDGNEGYYNTHDTQACVYLYASAQYAPAHTCDFGDWVDDQVAETHTRTCKDPECGKTETKPHGWDNGVQVGTPTCTEGAKTVYTCGDCGATYEDDIDNLGHDWGDWTDDGENSPTDTHSRICKRNCGVAAETENHSWSRWTPVDDNTHTKTCSGCNGTRTATHNWAEGVVAKEPTEFEEGLMTYTCGDCAHTKGEPIPKLNHNLTFVPAKDPTCTEDGNVAHYYCSGCQRYYSDEAGTAEIAAADVIRERIGHDWSEWTYDSVDSHIRNCKRNCGVEEEFDAHDWDEWTVYDDNTHRLTCSICQGYQEEEHDWDNGVETVSPTCYSTGVMTYTCEGCGHTKTEELPMTEHTWTDWAPNGDENHKRECMDDNCDAAETLPHSWDDGVVTTEPTCTEKGVKTYTCQICSHTKTEELPMIDHEWSDWKAINDESHARYCNCNASETDNHAWDSGVVTTEPTHTKKGVKTFTCTVCGHTYTEDIPETTEHQWTNWYDNGNGTHTRSCRCNASETKDCTYDDGVVTEQPSHVEPGTKLYTCTVCGHTYEEEIPVLPDHEWGEWVINKLDEANTHIRFCICNESQTAPHNFDAGVVTAEPTHTSKGVKIFTCTDGCGYSYTEEIPTTPEHSWTNWSDNGNGTHTRSCRCNASETKDCTYDAGVVTTEPTHTSKGVKTFTCTVCGHTYTEDIPETTEHQWTNWSDNGNGTHTRDCRCNANETKDCTYDDGVVTEQPSHVEPGTKLYTCTACGHTYEEEIPVLTDHAWGEWVINKLDEANTHIRFCICNESQTAPHNFDAGVVTKEATHLETGIKTFTCTDCGFVREDTIAKTTEHTFGEWKPEATVTGKHYRECACGARENGDCTYDAGVVTKEPTHYEEGEKTYTCTACGGKKTEAIAKTTAHEWSEWKAINDESHARYCNCNASETDKHAWDSGVVTTEPTHTKKGVKTFTCTVCGHTYTEDIPEITEHQWTNWSDNGNGTHTRSCRCNASETKDHNFDAGVVTKEATHLETGIKKFTCSDCGFVREETIAKTPEHTFGEWQCEATVVGKHYRECACGERETGDCTYDAGVVITEPTYEATGTKTYTCTACGGTKTETLDMLVKADEIVSPDNSEIKITAPEGSNAVLNENTVIKVEEVKDEISEEVKANVVEVVGGNDNTEILASYDISLILDGATVQPGGKVEVTLPAPENAGDFDTLQVVYIDDEGNVTPCETRVNADGTVTFVTDHFSQYAIIGVQNSSPVVWILISAISVALIAGAVVAVLVIKKKKGIA